MLRLKSSSWLAICAGRRITAAPDTSTEHTRHNNRVTVMVFLTVSLATCQPPLNLRLHNTVVNQRCKQVGKQDRQPHSRGKRRIYYSNNAHHNTNQRPKPPFTDVCHGG